MRNAGLTGDGDAATVEHGAVVSPAHPRRVLENGGTRAEALSARCARGRGLDAKLLATAPLRHHAPALVGRVEGTLERLAPRGKNPIRAVRRDDQARLEAETARRCTPAATEADAARDALDRFTADRLAPLDRRRRAARLGRTAVHGARIVVVAVERRAVVGGDAAARIDRAVRPARQRAAREAHVLAGAAAEVGAIALLAFGVEHAVAAPRAAAGVEAVAVAGAARRASGEAQVRAADRDGPEVGAVTELVGPVDDPVAASGGHRASRGIETARGAARERAVPEPEPGTGTPAEVGAVARLARAADTVTAADDGPLRHAADIGHDHGQAVGREHPQRSSRHEDAAREREARPAPCLDDGERIERTHRVRRVIEPRTVHDVGRERADGLEGRAVEDRAVAGEHARAVGRDAIRPRPDRVRGRSVGEVAERVDDESDGAEAPRVDQRSDGRAPDVLELVPRIRAALVQERAVGAERSKRRRREQLAVARDQILARREQAAGLEDAAERRLGVARAERDLPERAARICEHDPVDRRPVRRVVGRFGERDRRAVAGVGAPAEDAAVRATQHEYGPVGSLQELVGHVGEAVRIDRRSRRRQRERRERRGRHAPRPVETVCEGVRDVVVDEDGVRRPRQREAAELACGGVVGVERSAAQHDRVVAVKGDRIDAAGEAPREGQVPGRIQDARIVADT